MPDTIRILVRKECDQWVAQCLEVDICVQAPDLDTLEARLEVAIEAEGDLKEIGPAPQYYFDIYDTGRKIESPRGRFSEMKLAA